MKTENNKVIYRIWIDDFSYIGISKNLNKRISQHRLMFKKTFLDFQLILRSYKNGIPANNAFYYKLSCYLWWKNKKLEDFDYEVLEEINYEINEYDLEMKEQDYIAKYNSVLNGFNGPHFFRFKLERELQNMEPLLKKKYIQKYQENCKFYIEKIFKNQFKSPWVLFNFFDSDSKEVGETFWKIWKMFVELINKKVNSQKKENNFLNFLSSEEESKIFKNYHHFNFDIVQKWYQNIINSEEELKKNLDKKTRKKIQDRLSKLKRKNKLITTINWLKNSIKIFEDKDRLKVTFINRIVQNMKTDLNKLEKEYKN